jgi:pimeloyl-ACP methyl ester carboxylesterase
MWGPFTACLRMGATGVDVFAPDLRGRGTSRHAARDVHTMSLLADDLASDIKELIVEDEPLVLMGLSMGGYVLFEFLRRHAPRMRGRIAALVLADTRLSADDESGRAARLSAIAAIRSRGMDAAREAMLPRLLARGASGSEAERLTKTMILATPPETACADQLGMTERRDAGDVLATFTAPVLLVVGEEDAITPAVHAEEMAEALSDSRYVRLLTVPEAGHMAPLEKPNEVASAVLDLIRVAGRAEKPRN